MTYKLICPNCGIYTSAVFSAYESGQPCPHCRQPLNDEDGHTSRSFYAHLPD